MISSTLSCMSHAAACNVPPLMYSITKYHRPESSVTPCSTGTMCGCVNRCMACHSRRLTEDSQAPMVSVTHYMDRDANFLAEISPRRYFCEQCHVVQTEARPLLANDFVDIDKMLFADKEGKR